MQDLANDNTQSVLNKSIVKLYYKAIESSICEDYLPMQIFKQEYPNQYKRFNAIHRKRAVINESLSAMKVISDKVYFGTLTFNARKNLNKIATKRKEAFNKLNAIFEYVLLVEEYGEDNGRYHIHFLGVFKEDHNFDSFKLIWNHSRQNLELLKTNSRVSQYLCKYLGKDLPRIRRNKKLVALAREYHKGKSLQRFFPNVVEFSPVRRCSNYAFISALDDV